MFTSSVRPRLAVVLACAAGLAIASAGTARADEDQERPADRHQFTFSWQFAEDDEMQPRGGTSRGAGVRLADEPSAAWQGLQESGLSSFERDRRAILAMAGGYRASFDFLETVQYVPDAAPQRPYQSWGTEYVYVAEDDDTYISLQHVLVMYFVEDDGSVSAPIVSKHWRQDWRYEDTDMLVYDGHNRWVQQSIDPAEAEGAWTQAVYQVDDAPRYESYGRWVHEAGFSSWEGARTWRPLPRREYSVRSDYDVLEAVNRHTIVPNGWVHEENNLKLDLAGQTEAAGQHAYLARELGVNRYELLADFDFSAGHAWWERTAPFWADVRAGWSAAFAAHDRFALAEHVEGKPIWEHFFAYADSIEAAASYDATEAGLLIDEVIDAYLVPAP